MNNIKRNHTISRGSAFFLIVSLHFSLYQLWPSAGVMQEYAMRHLPTRLFWVLPEVLPPASGKPSPVQSVPPDSHAFIAPHLTVTPSAAPVSPGLPDVPLAVAADIPATVTTEAPPVSLGINRDISRISGELKKEFQQHDKLSSPPAPSAMAKLGERIQAAATTANVGVHYESVQTSDGRPVTKVITPFGTYCVLLRKPGEIIGNEPLTKTVSCGNL